MADPAQNRSPEQGPQHSRFGDQIYTLWRFRTRALQAAESEPTGANGYLQCIDKRGMPYTVWSFLVTATWITGYTVTYGRWVEVAGKGATLEKFVEDGTVSFGGGGNLNRTVVQANLGDRVLAYVSSITGTPGADGIEVIYKGSSEKPA